MKIWFDNHEIISQDRREGFMKDASCFIFFMPYTKKNATFFSKWKVVRPLTQTLDSPYTKHGNPHFHTEHRLNWLPHEYINTWLPLATLSVHAMKLSQSHDLFRNGTSPL